MSLFSSLVPSLARQPVATRSDAPASTERTLKPVYEIRETDDAFGVTAYLPGVTKDTLDITAEDSVLTIRGRRAWTTPKDWTVLYRESADAVFELSFTHDHAIDLDKIHAEIRDGVLRLSLPKAEAIKPRKIAIA